MFEVLEKQWKSVPSELRVSDSKAEIEISYAFVPMFPGKAPSYNAIMKRIQMPGNDHSLADQEIEAIKETRSFYYGRSKNKQIVYIALNVKSSLSSEASKQENFSIMDKAWNVARDPAANSARSAVCLCCYSRSTWHSKSLKRIRLRGSTMWP